MAELPEIAKYTAQMDETLRGRVMADVVILQEKCCNIPPDELVARIRGAAVTRVQYRGKWITHTLDNGETILLNYGMGADVIFAEAGTPDPEKYQIKVVFTDGTFYTAKFWWFGMFHLCPTADVDNHPSYKDVALDPFNSAFTEEYFAQLLSGKRTQVKSFMLNQKNIGGIGNMYAHDILWEARLHPQTKISAMTEAEVLGLYGAIQKVLGASRDRGSFEWEKDFHGQPGGWGGEGRDDFKVGYLEGEPCPRCATAIIMLKTGSTSSYLCPQCQVLA
ncbi:MAG: hypothetical protein LBH13_01540 [Cellulomonadaceae bacterium]|jgi:formamidopyrimidine-DNA glycosylase|nr:hypothetical protein [Cellulomonadaceae bacterium]